MPSWVWTVYSDYWGDGGPIIGVYDDKEKMLRGAKRWIARQKKRETTDYSSYKQDWWCRLFVRHHRQNECSSSERTCHDYTFMTGGAITPREY
jgi:hypothetical protein